MKRDCLKCAKEKENKQKDEEGVKNKRVEVIAGQLQAIITSSVDVPSGIDLSDIGKDNEFTWHQFHVKVWVARDFEGHAPVAMHNATRRAVPLTWLLLNI